MTKYTDYQLMMFEKPSLECADVVSLLGDYEDRDLPVSLHARVEKHISNCEFCREFEASYRAVIELASELRERPVPAGVSGRLRQRLNKELNLDLPIDS